MAPEYRLIYFDTRGRGETIRLLFAAKGVAYKDERMTGESWPGFKPNAPHQALPVLAIKDKGSEKIVCQSLAIARYLAREFGFGGSNNFEQLQIDEILGCVEDVFIEFIKFYFAKDPDVKAQAKKDLVEKYYLNLAKFLNLRLKEQNTGFLVGSKLTLADIYVFNFIDQRKMMGETFFDKEAEIMKLYDKVKADKGIADWLAKRPKETFMT